MKSYKDWLNEAVRHRDVLYELTDEDRKRLRTTLLEMYKDLNDLCEKHGIRLIVGGGTCLGAVRHQGFIPWDDDLDLLIGRRDYESLKRLVREGELKEKYEFRFPDDEIDSPCGFMKIYKRGTRMAEIGSEGRPYPQGVAIDLFVLDSAPANRMLRRMKGLVADMLRLSANLVYEASGPMDEASRLMARWNWQLGMLMRTRRLMGHLLSMVQHKVWLRMYDRLVRSEKETGWVAIPTGRKLYNGEVQRTECYFPPKKGWFEGVEVWLPNDSDRYLTNLYGKDYMKMPEVHERHFIVDYKL